MATTQIGIRIDPDLLKDLDEKASELGISRTAVITILLKKGLDNKVI